MTRDAEHRERSAGEGDAAMRVGLRAAPSSATSVDRPVER